MVTNHSVDVDDFKLDEVVKKSGSEDGGASRRAALPQDESPRRPGWRINFRVLIVTLLFLGAAGPALYFWREYQVERNAEILISRAEAMEAEEDWGAATGLYHRYLQLVPGDPKIVVAQARAFDKTAQSPDRVSRAITLFYQAVDAAPEDAEIGLRLSERLFELERWDVAQQQAERVLELDPDNLEAARLAALSLRARMGPRKVIPVRDVVEAHEAALLRHPGDPVLSESLATTYRESLGQFEDRLPDELTQLADRVVDEIVAVNPDDHASYLVRFRYRKNFDLAGAEEDLERAIDLGPDSPEVLLIAATQFLNSDLSRALEVSQRLLEVSPDDPRGYQILAEVQARSGDVDDAVATLNRGITLAGGENYALERTLLTVALESGRLELADETWKGLTAWFDRVSSYFQAKDRRLVDEDLQVSRARWLIGSGQAEQAVLKLKQLTAKFAEGGDADQNLQRREERWRLLAEAYGQLQQWDLAAQAMADAAKLRPTGYRSKLGEARYIRQSGDLERAIALVQEAAAKPDAPPTVWLVLAEMLIESEFQRGGDRPRDWRRVQIALDRARPHLGGSVPYISLRARWMLADGRVEEAVAELNRVLPVEEVAFESAGELALLFAAVGDGQTAEALVNRLRSDSAWAEEGESMHVELLARKRDYTGTVAYLDELEATGNTIEFQQLLPRLITVELEGGFVEQARKRLARWRDSGPTALPLLELGAAVAFQGRNWDELEKFLEALERVEGPNGSVWRFYRALFSLEDRPDQPGTDLVGAGRLLRRMEELRPNWAANLVVKGRIAEQQGKIDEAVTLYEQAVRQGARSVFVIDWLVSGLYRQNRFAEAMQYLRQLGEMAGLSTQVSGLAIPAYVREGRLDDAVRVTRMLAELHADEVMPQVIHGQALTLAEQYEDAEAVFRRAVERAPKDSRVWGGLVWYYARTGNVERVREVLAEINANMGLDPSERVLLTARGLGAIGEHFSASQRYEEVLAARPNDPAVLEEAARYHLQTNLERSLQLFRKLLAIDSESTTARYSIALILGLRGTEEGLDEALALIQDRDVVTPSPINERLETVLLSRGNEQQRGEAIQRLRDLVARENVLPTDRLLLAQVLERSDLPDEAQEQYELLLGTDVPADFLNLYLAFLLRQGKHDEVEPWLTRLEEKDAGGLQILARRSEWLAATGRTVEIAPLVERFLGEQTQDSVVGYSEVVRQSVAILVRNQLHEAAEKVLRLGAPRDPAVGNLLVRYLMEQKRLGDAAVAGIDHAVNHGQAVPPIPLTQVLTLMAAQDLPTSSLQEEAEQQLELGVTRHPDNLGFLFDLGTLRVMQGRNDEAIATYETTLRLRPDYPPSLNNLAIMLSAVPERRDEGLKMIERLGTLLPESAEVKDSHAMVLMACDRHEEALAILERLVEDHPENPRYLFHLAVASDQVEDEERAGEVFHAAGEFGLESELLTPTEKHYRQRMLAKYKPADGSSGAPVVPTK